MISDTINFLGLPVVVVGCLLVCVIIAYVIPKGFMRIGPAVRNEQRANRIHESVLSGLAYKYDRMGRGFGEKAEYMYWTERLIDGNLRVWRAWAKEGLMFKIELTSKSDNDGKGMKRSGSNSTNNYQG